MIITKYTKQKMDVLRKTHPDLHSTLKLHFPEGVDADSPELGKVAGLIIEYVLKAKGDPEIFDDNINAELELDDNPYNFDDI